MKTKILLFIALVAMVGCKKKSCYQCFRDYYSNGDKTAQSEFLELECGLTEREYEKKFRPKYPMQFNPEEANATGWYYHCEKQ